MPSLRIFLLALFLFVMDFTCKSMPVKDSIANATSSIATYNMFREPSKLMIGRGFGNLDPLIFEGDLIPYFMVSLNRDVRWGVEISPRIIMRMYNQKSLPVRNPSFMPRVTFFYQLIDNTNKKRDLFGYCALFHHSNGQDGDFYEPGDTTINTVNGSFSTNGIEVGAFLSRINPYYPSNINYVKFYVEYNFLQDNNLENLYGGLRLNADLQSSLRLEKLLAKLGLSGKGRTYMLAQSIRIGWIVENFNKIQEVEQGKLVFQYTLSFKPSFLNNVTVFTQFYHGQDYYNINFGRTLNVLRFGISSKMNVFN
ncbi:MAG: hypothetical protein RBR35_18030 [Salinivirgaceae bacterium]|nr:hypothetical protein [Salinivirgaceae bacterium]